MNVTPKDTMWVGDRLLRPESQVPDDDPLVVERPELFVWPDPEPVRRGRPNKPRQASDG